MCFFNSAAPFYSKISPTVLRRQRPLPPPPAPTPAQAPAYYGHPPPLPPTPHRHHHHHRRRRGRLPGNRTNDDNLELKRKPSMPTGKIGDMIASECRSEPLATCTASSTKRAKAIDDIVAARAGDGLRSLHRRHAEYGSSNGVQQPH